MGFSEVGRRLRGVASFEREASVWFSDPNQNILRARLEIAHAAVEAATVEARGRVRLGEGRDR